VRGLQRVDSKHEGLVGRDGKYLDSTLDGIACLLVPLHNLYKHSDIHQKSTASQLSLGNESGS